MHLSVTAVSFLFSITFERPFVQRQPGGYMFNYLEKIKENPGFYKQLAVDEQLITEYNCPLETSKETIWTSQDYFVYVLEGKKVWHTPDRSFELSAGKCLFVRKGAHMVEQFFDTRFCVVVFFVSDRFISDTIRHQLSPVTLPVFPRNGSPITMVDTDDALHAFFISVVPYFLNNREANKKLLELKFSELILNVLNNPRNQAVTGYFYSLLTDSSSERMQQILEENFHYNLRLEEFARLCGRSLSAFKREFEEHFKTTPGRWLLNRRLGQAQLLIKTSGKTVSEIAFECGFENASHFSRAFKERFGHSPSRFRQTMA